MTDHNVQPQVQDSLASGASEQKAQVTTSQYLTAMDVIGGTLIVSVSEDWDDEYLRTLQTTILRRLDKSSIRGLVIDLVTVRSVDSRFVKHLADIAKMSLLLGVDTRVTGVCPGIAVSMLALDLDCQDLVFESNIESALSKLSLYKPQTAR